MFLKFITIILSVIFYCSCITIQACDVKLHRPVTPLPKDLSVDQIVKTPSLSPQPPPRCNSVDPFKENLSPATKRDENFIRIINLLKIFRARAHNKNYNQEPVTTSINFLQACLWPRATKNGNQTHQESLTIKLLMLEEKLARENIYYDYPCIQRVLSYEDFQRVIASKKDVSKSHTERFLHGDN